MKRWAVLVVLGYLFVLLTLTMPVLLAAFYPELEARELAKVFSSEIYWVFLVGMGLCQAVMLLVPVDVTFRRPTRRRSVLWPLLASGLMIALLAAGAMASIKEFITRDDDIPRAYGWAGIGIVFAIWLGWTLVFYRLNRRSDPTHVVTRQCQLLLKGSILELLIAVPTHVVARHRDYCCAGFMTFVGITFGVAVMLFSFGPGLFFLFAQRWRQLHPQLEGGVD